MRGKNLAIVSTAALLLVGGYFVLLTPVEGQEQPPPHVFIPVDAGGWVDPQLPDDTILRSRPVAVNMVTLALVTPPNPNAAVPAVPIRFNLFDDLSVTVVFHKAKPRYDIQIPENPFDLLGQEFEPVGYTWSGDIVGEHQGYAIMVTKGEVCMANIYVTGGGSFNLRPSATGHVIREISATGPIECGVEAESSAGGGAAEGSGGGCGIDGATCDDGTVIDIMIVYTPAAKAEAAARSEDIEMIIDFAVEEVNEVVFPNSDINNTTLRLLYKSEVDYTEVVGDDGRGALGDLKGQWGGELDEVHPLRNALRADLVHLMYHPLPEQGAGSWTTLPTSESPIFESRGFSVVRWGVDRDGVGDFAHEFGHNMGCKHDRATHNCEGFCECSGACDFSFGYEFEALGKDYATIMATVAAQGIRHFSNPNVDYLGEPTGIAAGSCDSADCALTINTLRDTVANYRESCDTTDTTTRASFGFFHPEGDGGSREVSLSHNGQYMSFTSDSDNFGGISGFSDIFRYNRESGVAELISTHVTGTGSGDSFGSAESGNGRFVVFASDAPDLKLPIGSLPDTNGLTDIYVGSSPGGSLKRLSLDSNEMQATGGDSTSPSITFGGRFVAFASAATNLIGTDGNLTMDIFLRDRDGNQDLTFDDAVDSSTARVSLTTTGTEANGASSNPAISASTEPDEDGRFVAFESLATNLLGACLPGVSGDCNGLRDIFVRDTDEVFPLTFRVSISTANVEADGASFAPSISPTGRFIVFESDATNLIGACVPGVSGDCNGLKDIFLRDTGVVPAVTFRISDPAGVAEADGASSAPIISADARLVVFHSDATNLLGPGVDTNGQSDIFLYEISSGTITRASINSASEQSVGGGSFAPAISDHGRFIAFESDATNLAPGDVGGFRDIFFRDRGLCVGDLDGDGAVGDPDLAMLLALWGPVAPCLPYVVYDFNQDCDIGPADLAILLAN